MANAVAEKKKIKDDEFDIHGDLAVSESDDKSFVVLYDSSQENPQPGLAATPKDVPMPEAPSLEDLDESHALAHAVHSEDAYIDDILSSDDPDTLDLPPVAPIAHERISESHAALEDEDGPIALSSEELDGILEMGPATEEEFHPDFPVEHDTGHSESSGATGGVITATAPPFPTAEEHDAAGDTFTEDAPNYEDDELPIALSDEDLDEILLEEEGTAPAPVTQAAPPPRQQTAPTPAPAPVMTAPPSTGFLGDADDEEPIALSDDELDHILADAEAGHAAPELVPENDEDEILTLDENPELTMIDDSSAGFGDGMASAPDTTRTDSFFDSDEDEPITLSDEELDGILSTAPEEDAPKHTEEMALSDLSSDTSAPLGADSQDIEDDEPIALSNEELDGILMDADEPQDGIAELPPEENSIANDQGFFDGDADEPIALSADELDGIAATAVTEEAVEAEPLADLPPEGMESEGIASLAMDGSGAEEIPELDARYADVDHLDDQPAAIDDGEDDGPIALSTDELDGIVADSHEVTPEAPMMPLSPLDSGADEPSLADNFDKPATVFEEDLEAATLIHEDGQAAEVPAPDTEELKSVMTYLDNLLGELPDDVIEKFAQSEYFKMYQKIMDKLGL